MDSLLLGSHRLSQAPSCFVPIAFFKICKSLSLVTLLLTQQSLFLPQLSHSFRDLPRVLSSAFFMSLLICSASPKSHSAASLLITGRWEVHHKSHTSLSAPSSRTMFELHKQSHVSALVCDASPTLSTASEAPFRQQFGVKIRNPPERACVFQCQPLSRPSIFSFLQTLHRSNLNLDLLPVHTLHMLQGDHLVLGDEIEEHPLQTIHGSTVPWWWHKTSAHLLLQQNHLSRMSSL